MAWEGTSEQCRALLTALREVADRQSLGRLETCLENDEQTKKLAQKLSRRTYSSVHRTTLARWIEPLDPDPSSPITDEQVQVFRGKEFTAQQLVYDFLERSSAIRTTLYNPARELPEGFAAFLAEKQGLFEHLRFHALGKLDGTYKLYRRAWTTPERTDRVLISRLVIETKDELTHYREEQSYTDDARGNFPVNEIDEGLVLNSGRNIFLIGFGTNGSRVKFYCIHSWDPPVDGQEPVHELKGTVIGASGEGPHPGYRFIAYREEGEVVSEVMYAGKVSAEISGWIAAGNEAANGASAAEPGSSNE